MENDKTGLLLSQQDIELHREWFKEMVEFSFGNTTIPVPVGYKEMLGE